VKTVRNMTNIVQKKHIFARDVLSSFLVEANSEFIEEKSLNMELVVQILFGVHGTQL